MAILGFSNWRLGLLSSTLGFRLWTHKKEQAMKTKNYLILCAVITVIWSATLILVPAVSDTVEQIMIGFLSTYAR